MPKFEVRVWQTCDVQWAYTVEAADAESALLKVRDEDEYDEGPTMIDSESDEGNDWNSVEVEAIS